MTEKITKELLERSINEHKEFIKMVCLNKYGHDNIADVIDGVIKYCDITDEDQIRILKDGKFIPAGSILSACNSGKDNASFSNCYLTKIEEDSMDGIFECQKNLANTFKFRGGSGFDITILRPKDAIVNNAANTSSGAVSFMPSFSEVGKVVGQNGRRAAMICTLDIRHPDSLDFIWCKAKPEYVFKEDVFTKTLPDISSMNISLKISDEFMLAVEEDKDWTFVFPDFVEQKDLYDKFWDGDYEKWESVGGKLKEYKTLKARDILGQISEASWMCGDPGIFYIDHVQKNTFGTYISDDLKPISCNPCQPGWATVLTPEGISTFDDIAVGSTIWSEDGWVKVINKVCSGVKAVNKYTTSGGIFYGTDTHRIKSKGVKIEVGLADSIDLLKGCIDRRITEHIPEAVMDGLLIGDGSVHVASNNLVHLCIGENDSDYFDSEISDLILSHRPELHSRPIAWEVKTNLSYKDIPLTYLRRVPDCYKYSDSTTVASFLRGLYSANGSVLEKHNGITLKASSFGLIEDVQLMLSSLGIGSYFTTNKSKSVIFSNGEYVCKESYDLNITCDSQLFKDKIGFLQKYKQEKLKKICKKERRLFKSNFDIKSVDYVSDELVYDITVNGKSHTYWSGGLNVSNCGEQTLSYWNNCLLGSFVLTMYIAEGVFNKALFKNDIKTAVRLMNKFSNINENKHPLKNQRDADKFGKRIGIEFTGLGDVLAGLGFIYGDAESIEFCEWLSYTMLSESIKESIEIAKKFGPCEALSSINNRKDFLKNCEFHKDLVELFYEDILEHGLANSALLTVGPTGTLSIVSGNITSGLEPLFMFSYKRKNRIDGKEYSFIHYPAALQMLNNIREFEGLSLNEAKDKLNYVEADEIPWGDRIKIQAALQRNIDSSISSTVNLPKDCTKEEIQNIYTSAWKYNLKGITVFRDGCKNGVLSSINDKHEEQVDITTQEVFEKELFDEEYSVRHRVSWKGSKIYINVSIDEENNPIEVFTKLPKEAGISSDGIFNSATWNEHNSLWDSLCRCISVSLRYGVPLTEIINQLNKSTYSLVDAAGILKRILSKYILNDEEDSLNICSECGEKAYVFEGGCGKCLSCGYSSCG